MDLYYQALETCGNRYNEMLVTFISDNNYWGWQKSKTSYEEANKLWVFIEEFIQGCRDKLPLYKLNRWLGYIQGTMISWGITSVDEERDWTRPLFKPLDFPQE